jgi:CheY-like chemotaxis protein
MDPALRPGVLVVEDDAHVRAVLGLALPLCGFSVWLACGQEAVTLYTQHRAEVAMALLDVLMPGLEGPGTLTALRGSTPPSAAAS